MPVIPILFGLAAASFGAFFGSQIDDSIDQPPQATPVTGLPNPNTIIFYAAAGIGLYWGAKKAGLLK